MKSPTIKVNLLASSSSENCPVISQIVENLPNGVISDPDATFLIISTNVAISQIIQAKVVVGTQTIVSNKMKIEIFDCSPHVSFYKKDEDYNLQILAGSFIDVGASTLKNKECGLGLYSSKNIPLESFDTSNGHIKRDKVVTAQNA